MAPIRRAGDSRAQHGGGTKSHGGTGVDVDKGDSTSGEGDRNPRGEARAINRQPGRGGKREPENLPSGQRSIRVGIAHQLARGSVGSQHENLVRCGGAPAGASENDRTSDNRTPRIRRSSLGVTRTTT